MLTEIVTYTTLVATALAAGYFPFAALAQGRKTSAWWAIAGAEIMFFVAVAAVVEHWHEPIVWYREPLILIASGMFLAFAFHVFHDE